MHRPVQLLCCYDIQRLCFVLLIKQVVNEQRAQRRFTDKQQLEQLVSTARAYHCITE